MSKKNRNLEPGTRVRLKVRTMFGSIGPATIIRNNVNGLEIQMDCKRLGLLTNCCPHEVSRMKDQTPFERLLDQE